MTNIHRQYAEYVVEQSSAAGQFQLRADYTELGPSAEANAFARQGASKLSYVSANKKRCYHDYDMVTR